MMHRYKFTIIKEDGRSVFLTVRAENLEGVIRQAIDRYPISKYKLACCMVEYSEGKGGNLINPKLFKDTVKSVVESFILNDKNARKCTIFKRIGEIK